MILDAVRFPTRVAAFAGITVGFYAVFETQQALMAKEGREAHLHTWIERHGRTMLRVFGIEPVGSGPYLGEGRSHPGTDERGLGRIFIMNHRSGFDILLTMALFEAAHVSRADLAKWPFVGVLAKRIGTLFVDRESKMSGAAVLHAMCTAVQRGRGIIVFPEGTTHAGDEVRAFRPGAFAAAVRTGAEIVPVGVAYESPDAEFGDESFLDHMKRAAGAPRTRVGVAVGDPITSVGVERDALQAQGKAAVQALIHVARASLRPASP